jgi:hypothetical protein
MDAFWWTIFIVAIVFYTLWAAGAFGRKKKDGPEEKR